MKRIAVEVIRVVMRVRPFVRVAITLMADTARSSTGGAAMMLTIRVGQPNMLGQEAFECVVVGAVGNALAVDDGCHFFYEVRDARHGVVT